MWASLGALAIGLGLFAALVVLLAMTRNGEERAQEKEHRKLLRAIGREIEESQRGSYARKRRGGGYG